MVTRFAITTAITLILFTTGVAAAGPNPSDDNIVEIAVAAGNFQTLVAAVQAAGLAETLSGPGPFTVFAPTDEAFAKLPEGTIEALLADTEKLGSILTYHVVPGKVMARDVVTLTKAATANGQDVQIKVRDGKVLINDATVMPMKKAVQDSSMDQPCQWSAP